MVRLTIIGSLLLAGCFIDPSSPEAQLGITLRMNDNDLAAGENVTFTVIATNPSDEDAVIHGSSSCILGVQVKGAGGEVVYTSSAFCTDDLAEFRIRPDRVNGMLTSQEVQHFSESKSFFVR